MNESETVPGDIFETPDGNRYLVLPNDKLAYLGNKVLSRSTDLIEKDNAPCRRIGRMTLPQYRENDEALDDYWDAVQGVERIPAPLPNGCTCTDTALMDVLKCAVHRVSNVAPHPLEKIFDWLTTMLKAKWVELSMRRPYGELDLEVRLELSGRTSTERGIASQSHAATVRLNNGTAEFTSTHSSS